MMGPLIDTDAVDQMMATLKAATEQAVKFLWAASSRRRSLRGGCYVTPAVVKAHPGMDVVKRLLPFFMS